MKKIKLITIASLILNINNFSETIITTIGQISMSFDDQAFTNINSVISVGGKIYLGDGTNEIIMNTSNITNPASGSYAILGIDSNGILAIYNFIEMGIPGNNEVYCPLYTNGDVQIISKTYGVIKRNIQLKADGNIKIYSNSITPVSSIGVVLATHNSNNLMTSGSNMIYLLGNTGTNNNYLKVDNATTTNGIILNGRKFSLTGNTALLPSVGTNTLTIDTNGVIGVTSSSRELKDNIKNFVVKEEDFYALNPVCYSFKGKNDSYVEYGLLAEELINNESFKNTVINNKEGKPMSIHYNSVFIAFLAKFIDFSKAVQEKIKKLEIALENKEEIIFNLDSQLQIQSKTIDEFKSEINELKTKNYEIIQIISNLI